MTICVKAKDALSFLREEKARFDIVIADIHNMVDMDGFDFLATLTAELKSLPIVISKHACTVTYILIHYIYIYICIYSI